jgi:hypothetical protein
VVEFLPVIIMVVVVVVVVVAAAAAAAVTIVTKTKIIIILSRVFMLYTKGNIINFSYYSKLKILCQVY